VIVNMHGSTTIKIIWPVESEVAACINGCNYSLRTPDDVCGRRPKRVE
jgi:hypothetical protein